MSKEAIYQKRTKQGCWVSLFFYKIPFDYTDETNTHHYITAISVALRIGESKHHNKRWFNYDPKYSGSAITGNGSLENLWTALQLLQKYELKYPQTTIVIFAEDSRRYNAYKWLKRYGYEEYDSDAGKCLVKLGKRR